MKIMTSFSGLLICLCVILVFLSGCSTGYRKIDGKWSYVTWDEGHGYRTYPLGADEGTFEVLESGKYAKDKHKVYYQRYPISGADPASFVLLNGKQYAKDKDHVYLLEYHVINADPSSFKEIAFPYARDKKNVYCGTVPLDVKNIEEFEVTQSASGYDITSKDDFIRRNKEYSFLRDTPVDTVVTGWGGKAKTKTEYFEGCNKRNN
jgi:DKNYY family protein